MAEQIVCINDKRVTDRAELAVALIEKVLHDTQYDRGQAMIKIWCDMWAHEESVIARLVVQTLENHHSEAVRVLTSECLKHTELQAAV